MKPIRTTKDLIEHIAAGGQPKYLFFWGHQPSADGSIGKSCLSQWFEAPFVVDRVRYATAEHFMMAGKARLFGNGAAEQRILAAKSPAQAKKLGRGVQGFDDKRWEQARFEIVVMGNVAKFSQSPALKAFLVGTGDRVMVEASPVDAVWGIGLAADDPNALEPQRWKGLNLLGFALMEARQQLLTT